MTTAGDRQKRVLLVEDDPSVRPLLVEILVQEGLEVVAVETCQEARSLILRVSWDVVVADKCLSDGDGLEIVNFAAAQDLSSFMITGDPAAVDQLDEQHIPFLLKPFSPSALLARVGAALLERNLFSPVHTRLR
jgi:two-component system OmpR family response regulator